MSIAEGQESTAAKLRGKGRVPGGSLVGQDVVCGRGLEGRRVPSSNGTAVGLV